MSDTPASASDLILYRTEDGQERIEVRLENETVWLSQMALAELASGATVKQYLTVQTEDSRSRTGRLLEGNCDDTVGTICSGPRTGFQQDQLAQKREDA